MRIPLDYYRILGLPIQATAEQLQQAHRDRTLQLPRREFSEVAIESRKQLIDQAYAVLSDPADRQDYDTGFLAKSYDLLEVGRSSDLSTELSPEEQPGFRGAEFDSAEAYSPQIEIQDEQLVGALLILLEMGEYELVLKHSTPYVDGANFALKQGRLGDPDLVAADIALTHALSCLELGREQWHQGQYENAAESLRSGQEVLLRQGLFPHLRGEMQSDLYKLRPYRILELVALPESQSESRQQGLDLLQDMLQDRNGIDGSGDDQSGLSIDDFLRFIQQLRSYLTAAEQQALFEVEARRPSPVALYLSVYALLARGFADRQPALIRRAKTLLLRLSARQDVHLEQAVCALLLGQTEEASRSLEMSQEFESIGFIREHSQDAPDLLPGLCLYSERWLQNEVFPHFRDLARKQASLKEYFADEDVQSYLEELPSDPEPVSPWSSRRSGLSYRPPAHRNDARLQPTGQHPEPELISRSEDQATALSIADTSDSFIPSNGTGVTTAERMTPYESGENGQMTGTKPRSPQRRPRGTAPNGNRSEPSVPTRRMGGGALRMDRVLLLAAIGTGIILLGILLARLLGNRSQPPQTAPVAEGISQVQPLGPVLEQIIPPQAQATTSATLDESSAATVIQSWLSAKAAAMGEEHEIDQLSTILADPALSGWRERAEQVQSSNSYWQYEHSEVEVTSVEMLSSSAAVDETPAEDSATSNSESSSTPGATDANSPENGVAASTLGNASTDTESSAAIVEATVTERGSFYNNGQLDESSSYDDSLQVRYNLIRENGQWRIQDWEVLQ